MCVPRSCGANGQRLNRRPEKDTPQVGQMLPSQAHRLRLRHCAPLARPTSAAGMQEHMDIPHKNACKEPTEQRGQAAQ
jgi:hypothetical protein